MRAALAVLAALGGMAFAQGVPYVHRVEPTPVYRRPTSIGRSRIRGKPGRAGDKLRRMAAAGRVGVGHPK